MKYKKSKVRIGTYSSTKELLPGLNKSVNKSAAALNVNKRLKKY